MTIRLEGQWILNCPFTAFCLFGIYHHNYFFRIMLCGIHFLHPMKRVRGFQGFRDASFIYKPGKYEVNFISHFCVKFGEFFTKIATRQQRSVCTPPMLLEIVKIHMPVFADRRFFCFGKCQQGIKVTVPILVCDSIFHIHILSFSYFMVTTEKGSTVGRESGVDTELSSCSTTVRLYIIG